MTYEEKLQKIQQLQELLAAQTQQVQELRLLTNVQPAHVPTALTGVPPEQAPNIPANPNMPMGWEQQPGTLTPEMMAQQIEPGSSIIGNVGRDVARFIPQQMAFAEQAVSNPIDALKGLGQFVGGGMNMAMQYSPLGDPNIGQRMANQAEIAQQFKDRPVETLFQMTSPVGVAEGLGKYVSKGKQRFLDMKERARAKSSIPEARITEESLPPAPSPEVMAEVARKRAEKAGQEFVPEPIPAPALKSQSATASEPKMGTQKPKLGTKEPWEMTQRQYENTSNSLTTSSEISGRSSGELKVADYIDGRLYIGKPGEMHATIAQRVIGDFQKSPDAYLNREIIPGFWDSSRSEFISQDKIAYHRLLVRSALSEGKPVPFEVLKDYPDLAAKYKPKSVTSETPQAVKDIAARDEWNKAKQPEAQGLSKAEQDRLRLETQEMARKADMPEEITSKLDKLPEAQRRPWVVAAENAKSRGLDQKAVQIADDVIKTRRPINDAEHMALHYKAVELKKEYNGIMKQVTELQDRGDMNSARAASDRAELLIGDIDKVTQAARYGTREAARTLSIAQTMMDMDTYDLASVTQRVRAMKGRKLTPAETTKLQKVTEDYAKANERIQELQANYDKLQAEYEKTIADQVAGIEAKRAKIEARKGRLKEKIAKERGDIKKQLADLGYRVNDITGVTAEGSYLVGKLAVSYIKDGITNLDALVKKVKNDVPQLSDRDVWQSLNARDPKRIKQARSETVQKIAEIKSTARLLSQIADAEQGIFKAPQSKQIQTIPKIQALRRQLNELRTKAYATATDGVKLDKAHQTINELQDMLANHYRNIKKKKPIPSDELAATQAKIKGLRRQMYVEDQLIDLNNQIKTGEFKIRPKPGQRSVPPEIERAEIELKMKRKAVQMAIQDAKPWTKARYANEAINTMRTMKATADMSAMLRQGLIGTIAHPVYAATRAFPQAAKAFFSEHTAQQIDNAIRSADHHYIRERSKLHLSDIDAPKATAREEMFMSNVAEKIPVFKKLVQGSERHMTTYLNMLRANAFDEFFGKYPNATAAELEAWAKWINVSTGRGTWAPEMMNKLGAVIFAPRFAVSRIQVPIEGGKAMVDLAFRKNMPRVSKEIAKDVVKAAGVGMTALTLAKLGGATVGTDPRESDWGKISVGNTHYDIWGGMQQPMRVAARSLLGLTDKAGMTGRHLTSSEKEIDPLDLMWRFSSYKLGPGVTLPKELYTGKTMVGEKRTPLSTLAHQFIPMVYEDMYDAWKDGGWGRAASVTSGAFIGIGTNTYEFSKSRTKRDIKKLEAEGDYTGAIMKRIEWNTRHWGDEIR